MICVYAKDARIKKYRLKYLEKGVWKTIYEGGSTGNANIHRFDTVWGGRVRIEIDEFTQPPSITEFGVFNERR